MVFAARRNGALILMLVMSAALPRAWGDAAPATAPAARAKELKLGDEVSVRTLFTAVALKYGAIIVEPKPLEGKVTMFSDLPEEPERAVRLVNDMIYPLGYQAVRSARGKPDRLLLRIATIAEAKAAALAEGPVTTGTDSRKIDVSERDRMVTHIVPITHGELIEAARHAVVDVDEVDVLQAGSAEIGLQLIVTGPALTVRKAVDRIVAIDGPGDTTSLMRSLKLKNLDARTGADTVMQSHAGGEHPLRAVPDRRTNTVILIGSEADVFGAMGELLRLDAVPPPALKIEIPERTFIPLPAPADPATQPEAPGRPGARGNAPPGHFSGMLDVLRDTEENQHPIARAARSDHGEWVARAKIA